MPEIGLPMTGSDYQRQKDSMKAEANKEYNEFLKGVIFTSCKLSLCEGNVFVRCLSFCSRVGVYFSLSPKILGHFFPLPSVVVCKGKKSGSHFGTNQNILLLGPWLRNRFRCRSTLHPSKGQVEGHPPPPPAEAQVVLPWLMGGLRYTPFTMAERGTQLRFGLPSFLFRFLLRFLACCFLI